MEHSSSSFGNVWISSGDNWLSAAVRVARQVFLLDLDNPELSRSESCSSSSISRHRFPREEADDELESQPSSESRDCRNGGSKEDSVSSVASSSMDHSIAGKLIDCSIGSAASSRETMSNVDWRFFRAVAFRRLFVNAIFRLVYSCDGSNWCCCCDSRAAVAGKI